MVDYRSADKEPLVSRNAARDAIAKALKLYVGRGRRYSVKELANGTGIKDRVIECAMAGAADTECRSTPPEALLSIALFLGADFTNKWLQLAAQGAFDLPDDEPDPGALAADNSDDNAAVTRAAIDGVFDQAERKVLPLVGARMMTRGAQLVATGRAA
jgi:hypothetical protein